MALLGITRFRDARRWWWCVAGFLVFAGWGNPAIAQSLSREREVQAVFLLNLTRFVRWPEVAFAAEDAPLTIGVLGEDPVGTVLEAAARGESSGKHPIVIRRVQRAADLAGCHVVFFPKSRMTDAVEMIPVLRAKSILTVSDADGFLPLGGHVQLYSRGGQMKLRLDLDNLKRGELNPSAQLLRVAEIVDGDRARRGGVLRLLPGERFVGLGGGRPMP
jgi:hypothetical protein